MDSTMQVIMPAIQRNGDSVSHRGSVFQQKKQLNVKNMYLFVKNTARQNSRREKMSNIRQNILDNKSDVVNSVRPVRKAANCALIRIFTGYLDGYDNMIPVNDKEYNAIVEKQTKALNANNNHVSNGNGYRYDHWYNGHN